MITIMLWNSIWAFKRDALVPRSQDPVSRKHDDIHDFSSCWRSRTPQAQYNKCQNNRETRAHKGEVIQGSD